MSSEVDDLVIKWQRTKNPLLLVEIRKKTAPLIGSQLQKFRSSNVPESVLKAKADEILIESLKSFKPGMGALFTTHLFGNLRRLGRFTIERANVARIPEARAQKIGLYQQVRQQLIDERHRPPTTAEMSDELAWDIREVARLERELRLDITSSSLPVPSRLDMTDAREERLANDIWWELTPDEQVILDYTVGLHGKPQIKEGKALAKKLGWSQAKVSLARTRIANKMKKHL